MLINNDQKNLAARFVFESNLIEGIEVPISQIVAQLERTIITGHTGALLYMNCQASEQKLLTEADLRHCEKLIIAEQNALGLSFEREIPKRYVGNYRNVDVMVG